MRYNNNENKNGIVKNGFDYDLQVWIKNYIILLCGHKKDFICNCNGKKFVGRDIRKIKKILLTNKEFDFYRKIQKEKQAGFDYGKIRR